MPILADLRVGASQHELRIRAIRFNEQCAGEDAKWAYLGNQQKRGKVRVRYLKHLGRNQKQIEPNKKEARA